MMKSVLHTVRLTLLAVTLIAAQGAGAFEPAHQSKSASFKGGFSSQRQQAAPPARQQSAPPVQQSQGRSGGFGSFGGAPARNGQASDSALSRRLDKNASEANALRTLDERRAAQQGAGRDTRPVPGYEERQAAAPAGVPMPAPMQVPAPAPVIVRQDSGIGQVVTGYVLGRMANGGGSSNGAQNLPNVGGYPGKIVGTATVDQAPAGRSFFGGVLHLLMWLIAAAAIFWLGYFAFRRLRRRRAANQPNYTFERN